MAYQNLALLYDQLMKDAPYKEWVQFTEGIFKKRELNVKKIADLGCGTGEITTKLAQRGYHLIGIDNSSEMLSLANDKAKIKHIDIQWLEQDLTGLTGITQLDAAISYCDVINYIPNKQDLIKVFTNIHHSLKDGGVFVFDVHSLFHVDNHLKNQTFADVTDEYSYIWFCMEGDTLGEMFHELTFFTLEGNTYHRFHEIHHQKTYAVETYTNLLRQAGFHRIDTYGDFSLETDSYDDETERIFFVAEKESKK